MLSQYHNTKVLLLLVVLLTACADSECDPDLCDSFLQVTYVNPTLDEAGEHSITGITGEVAYRDGSGEMLSWTCRSDKKECRSMSPRVLRQKPENITRARFRIISGRQVVFESEMGAPTRLLYKHTVTLSEMMLWC